MKRIWMTCLVLGAGLAACDSRNDRASRTNEDRREADRKAAEISSETDKKIAESQKKASEEQDRIAREGQEKLDDVRRASERKMSDVDDALVKARADLRDSTQRTLDDLDKRAEDVNANLEKSLARPDYEKIRSDLRSKSESVKRAMSDLDNTTDMDAGKRTLQSRLDDYEKAIDNAKKRT